MVQYPELPNERDIRHAPLKREASRRKKEVLYEWNLREEA